MNDQKQPEEAKQGDWMRIIDELDGILDAASFALVAVKQGKTDFFAFDIQNALDRLDASDDLIRQARAHAPKLSAPNEVTAKELIAYMIKRHIQLFGDSPNAQSKTRSAAVHASDLLSQLQAEEGASK